MSSITWDDGQRTVIRPGDLLECRTLQQGQIYGIYLYNDNLHDEDIIADVVWSNAAPPVHVRVPGTTGLQGLASVAVISGNDTSTISVSTRTPAAELDCWLVSVSMPIDDSNLSNLELPLNGEPQPFGGSTRYFAVPPAEWCNVTLTHMANEQFIAAGFRESKATFFILNPTDEARQDADVRICPVGRVQQGKDYTIELPPPGAPQQTISHEFHGDGMQRVWMGTDSRQGDPKSSTLTGQALGTLYSALRRGPGEKVGYRPTRPKEPSHGA